MFWPFILPIEITFWCLTGIVVLATLSAPMLRWGRGATFLVSSVLAVLLFVPSCAVIMSILDRQRFGVFHCFNFSEVHDFRVERYLPWQAKGITVEKQAAGNRAQYSITESELREYLDTLWQKYGKYSAIPKDNMNYGTRRPYSDVASKFEGLDWPPLGTVIEFRSPAEEDGGGAEYYFDPLSETVYQRAGYW